VVVTIAFWSALVGRNRIVHVAGGEREAAAEIVVFRRAVQPHAETLAVAHLRLIRGSAYERLIAQPNVSAEGERPDVLKALAERFLHVRDISRNGLDFLVQLRLAGGRFCLCH
jgi:hypothetical protein